MDVIEGVVKEPVILRICDFKTAVYGYVCGLDRG
jgi:hypothetical protein